MTAGRTCAATTILLNQRKKNKKINSLLWLASGHSRTSTILTPASWFVTSDLQSLTNQRTELETQDPDCNLMVFIMLKCVFNPLTLPSKYILIFANIFTHTHTHIHSYRLLPHVYWISFRMAVNSTKTSLGIMAEITFVLETIST